MHYRSFKQQHIVDLKLVLRKWQRTGNPITDKWNSVNPVALLIRYFVKLNKIKMETINLVIPSMKSPHCMMTVSGVIKNMEGALLKKIMPGEAEIELSGTTKTSVVDAIEKAGYPVANNEMN